MKEIKADKAICKSIFKNGKSSAIKNQFTKKWIELINRMEKSNRSSLGGRQ